IVIGCADPRGAAMYSLFTTGEAKASEGGSVAEGIGLGRKTPVIDGIPVDTAFLVPDEEAIPGLFELADGEGLLLGGSSAINIAGAVRLAKEMGPGHTIVTMLCDHGSRYQSKLYNADFLRSKNLPVPAWLERTSTIKPDFVTS
ncbi:MAG: pyridoxal-phosphate dependent enzyme, partial [Novosphingobium sp.]|nr:pyridoxal-phosphate dependent enzyme [Novosphingobium sp.]